MKKAKRFIALIVILVTVSGCKSSDTSSSFSIRFIDVGQGDSALVECDGRYMLIDGGDTNAGNKVYSVLEEQGIQRLDILVISHLDVDHIGGLPKTLTYVSRINKTISNENYSDKKAFKDLEYQLGVIGSKITIPHEGEKYSLGSAEVEVVDVSAVGNNDSLVILITYGDTRFLFTGDIEATPQTRISDKYQKDTDETFKIDLMKMPHHGSYSESLYRFVRTFMPDYVVISVGADNLYGHPHTKTLGLLDSKTYKPKLYRTDYNGDIVVQSDGKELLVKTEK